MRLDHVSYAAGPDGLVATAKRLGNLLGQDFVDGGVHPRFGTRNYVMPLRGGLYVEVVEALEHPASDKAPFGQAVKLRSSLGGGWMGWVVSVDDMGPIEQRLQRGAVPGNRTLPDGTELHWHQIGINGLIADPQLPYFIKWEMDPSLHPGNAGSDVTLTELEISGSQERVQEWLGEELGPRVDPWTGKLAENVGVKWIAEHGTPGLIACCFSTPNGEVRI